MTATGKCHNSQLLTRFNQPTNPLVEFREACHLATTTIIWLFFIFVRIYHGGDDNHFTSPYASSYASPLHSPLTATRHFRFLSSSRERERESIPVGGFVMLLSVDFCMCSGLVVVVCRPEMEIGRNRLRISENVSIFLKIIS